MPFQFNAADLEQQMRVRGVFDPAWLLNPPRCFRSTEGSPRDDPYPARRAGRVAIVIREAAEAGTPL